jgi:hypothetical protein
MTIFMSVVFVVPKEITNKKKSVFEELKRIKFFFTFLTENNKTDFTI